MSTVASPARPHPSPAVASPGSSLRWAISDCATMVGRSVRHVVRDAEGLLLAVILPVMIMVMFVHVLGGGLQTGLENYVDYAVPGVLLLCTGYNAAVVASSVAMDMTNGVIDRFRSMPIASSSVLVGHVIGSLIRNLFSAVIVVLVALLLGWSPNATPVEWLAAAGLVALFILAMSTVSTAFGILVGSPESASTFSFFLLFLPYVSSGFLPVESLPSWLHGFAENQPMTPMIESLRGLLMGTPIGSSAILAIAWFGGIAVVGGGAASVLFSRRSAR
ncbi:ABC transporter permease [Georgenia sp. TF02-10]|uniref:ABC transporter permease n=1 Tax=Georgenia sp. TF02-10 TaxID=2917725 RepID=UPI001FA6B6B3|nr:ABC transporter permease [Georgenia sp. TF02-10]UNX55048.1 ABC transporter permease [Georgenia sp. TF02-10]